MKKIYAFAFFCCFSLSLFSNAADRQGKLFLAAGPTLQINTDGLETAPSPISFSLGLGYSFSLNKDLAINPELGFWSLYYLYLNDRASPAAVEKRDVQALHFLLDIPLLYKISTENNVFSFGLGIALLSRVAFATAVLPENEEYKVGKINDFFWSDFRYLYPEATITWDWVLENGSSFGLSFKAYYPVANFITEQSSPLQNNLFSLKVRCFFPPQSKQNNKALEL